MRIAIFVCAGLLSGPIIALAGASDQATVGVSGRILSRAEVEAGRASPGEIVVDFDDQGGVTASAQVHSTIIRGGGHGPVALRTSSVGRAEGRAAAATIPGGATVVFE